MEFDKRMIYPGIILFLAASAFVVFNGSYFSDSDYAALIRSGMPIETASMANAALFITLPLLVYAITLLFLKADAFNAFCASALFALSAANVDALFSIHPVLSAALGQSYDIFRALQLAGALLPLAILAVAEHKKSFISVLLAAAGAIALPFAPGPAAFILALAAPAGISALENPHYGDKALMFLAFVFAFQAAYIGDLTAALVAGALIAAITYVASSLHNMKSGEIAAIILLLISFNTLAALHSATSASANSLSSDEIAAFRAAKELEGTFGVLGYPNTFKYYSRKEAELLNASALMKKGEIATDYVVLSLRLLDSTYSSRPVLFAYVGSVKENQRSYAVFANRLQNTNYIIYMALAGSELSVDDAQLYDLNTKESAVIPYTKMRLFGNGSFRDPATRMVNLQAIEGSALQSLLFSSEQVFAQNGSMILKVR